MVTCLKCFLYSVSVSHPCVIVPREAKEYSFELVRLSVRPSVTLFFLFCALIDSETTQSTTMKPIPYESWGSGLCHMGVRFFLPPKISA